MTNLDLPDLSGSGFMTANAALADAAIAVTFAGTADTETRADLDRYVKQLHGEALRLRVPAVVLDLRDLEFMNSSCLKILVAWLAQLRDLPTDQQYKIRIRSNPNLLWQRRSLAALSCFAVDLVTIET
jgi:anti-anti-sigma factor